MVEFGGGYDAERVEAFHQDCAARESSLSIVVTHDELPQSYHERRLTLRDRKIIEHVSRYRLTTVEVLCRAVLPGLSRTPSPRSSTASATLPISRKYTLLHPTKYFVLNEASVNSFGVDTSRSTPLGPNLFRWSTPYSSTPRWASTPRYAIDQSPKC